MNFSHTECALHVLHTLARRALQQVPAVLGLSITPKPKPVKEVFTGQPPRETPADAAAPATPAVTINEAEGAKFTAILKSLLETSKTVQGKVNQVCCVAV